MLTEPVATLLWPRRASTLCLDISVSANADLDDQLFQNTCIELAPTQLFRFNPAPITV
jgi:hypothetical protein